MTMNDIQISFGDDENSLADLACYQDEFLANVLSHTLNFIHQNIDDGLLLPYFEFDENLSGQDWADLPKSLDIYVCGTDEGRELNLDARGKDYATNILSYPSDIPSDICQIMNHVPLGELVICHDVVVREASEQGKTVDEHLTHLVVHGVLHLLGFDHELGQAEQDEMEGFEIAILRGLGIKNPYE